MGKLKKWCRKLYTGYMNLKLAHKFMLCYIFIILLPTLAFGFSLYFQNYGFVKEQYMKNEKFSMETSKKNLNMRLNKIEEAVNFLHSSKILLNYLGGFYDSEAEELYYYIKDIQPLLSYIRKTDPAITDIRFYASREHHLSWGGVLYHSANPTIPASLKELPQTLVYGAWYHEPGDTETISFYRSLYDFNYRDVVAVLRINVNLPALMDSFSSTSGALYFSFNNDTAPLLFSDQKLTVVPAVPTSGGRGSVTMSVSVPELDCSVFLNIDRNSFWNGNSALLLSLLPLLIFLLSASYYWLIDSITRRLLRLERHINRSNVEHLVPLEEPEYHDEIDRLVSAYNRAIQRINDLLFQIYHMEIKKRDAEYYALQAQIEPHFLYNILENIHMSAEKANDRNTAEMVVSLGSFMRYNLNNNTGLVRLSSELTHAKNYLNLHKIRMRGDLRMEIFIFTDIGDVICPRFILQPLIENTLKHSGVTDGSLLISITVKDRYEGMEHSDVVLEVHDNGQGIDPQVLKQLRITLKSTEFVHDSHIGLSSISSRLQALFGYDYALKVESSSEKGTSVIIFLKRMGDAEDENTGC